MNDLPFPDMPFVQSVLHPSDFSPASADAFANALAIALRRRTRLSLFHVVAKDEAVDVLSDFPAVRGTLERWGILQKGSAQADVLRQLGVGVTKVNMRSGNVVNAVTRYLEEHPTDLIVLATEGRDGLPRWIQGSVAEKVARRAETMTLFVPQGGRGLVSLDDGKVSLRRILVPVDHEPDPQTSVVYATRAAGMADGAEVEIVLLHVGDSQMPRLDRPKLSYVKWDEVRRSGSPIDEIIKVAGERSVDLIVMATQGHDGILDALRGSVTEQVVRRAGCAVLAVPLS